LKETCFHEFSIDASLIPIKKNVSFSANPVLMPEARKPTSQSSCSDAGIRSLAEEAWTICGGLIECQSWQSVMAFYGRRIPHP